MKRIERCEYGHIRAEKRKNIFGALSMILIGVAIFVLGLCLNKFEKANIFTIIAVLFVLPMARFLTTWIILLPYKTPEEALYRQVKETMPEGSILLSDYVFTLGERVHGISFFVLTGNELIGLMMTDKKKTDKKKTNKTADVITTELKRRGISGKVVLFQEKERFFAELHKISSVTRTEEEMQELVDFLRSLAV